MNKTNRRMMADLPEGGESPLAHAVVERDRATISMVRDALDQKNLLLAYQPVMQVNRPDRPAFYEGLIRLLDDTGRVIPARDFMETVEMTELGRRIDCAALGMGLQALKTEPSLRLSINLSARSIAYPEWTRTLRRGLQGDPKLGERLILEISEASAMLMPDIVSPFMTDLQGQGISFALDNFGAGLTSFRHFKDLFFDILKIDGQFSKGIATDTDNQVLAAALIGLARHFDMFSVAERVESEADAEHLAGIGIDCMQGYYYGAPTTTPPWKMPAQRRSA